MLTRLTKTAYMVKKMFLGILGGFSGYLKNYAEEKAQSASPQPGGPFDDFLATGGLDQIETIAKNIVEDYLKDRQTTSEAPGDTPQKEDAVQPALEQHPDQVQPLSLAANGSSTPQPSQEQQSGLSDAVPVSKPGPKQIRENLMPKTGAKSPEVESNQLSKIGRFGTYRTPPRSVSGTVTDSSDEKKQRNTDASLLSPQKAYCPADFPTKEFESLRVSERENTQDAPKEPPDAGLTLAEGGIAGTSSKLPILGSMEYSKFAVPVKPFYQINNTKVIGVLPSLPPEYWPQIKAVIELPTAYARCLSIETKLNDTTDISKAGTTSEENTILSASKAPQDAPASRKIICNEGSSSAVSQEQRSTLAQSTSNIRKETFIKETPPAAGPKAAQGPDEKKSRVFSGGMGESIWAVTDSEPSKFASLLTVRKPVWCPQNRD